MWAYLVKGGPLVFVIGLCSVLAGMLSLVAWWRLREASQSCEKPLSELFHFIERCDWNRALSVFGKYRHPFLQTWRRSFLLLSEGKSDLGDLEEIVSLEGALTIARLESPLKPLGALIVILPMLGFLGTIVGLMMSFQNWEQLGAQVSVSALAGGIYQAMITTAAGLITAIPYHFIYHHFAWKAQRVALHLSRDTTELFRRIKSAIVFQTPMPEAVVHNQP